MAAALAAALLGSLALTPSAGAARPNILVIATDDQRADGTMQVMPSTRRIFKRGGTEFPNAVTTTPTCCPSRASIMSGKYAHNHGVFHNHDNEDEITQLDKRTLIARRLQKVGYRTGIVGKYLNSWPTSEAPPDFDDFSISQGPFYDTLWNINGQVQRVSTYSTSFVGRRASSFVRRSERRDRKPWFLYVVPFAPHSTFTAEGVIHEPAAKYAGADVGPLPANPARLESSPLELADKPAFWRQAVADYTPGPGAPDAAETREGQLRMLMSVDDMVGRLFRRLRKTRETKRTLAIYTSDNGFFWGEHGAPPAKDMPYEPSVKVPFFMRWPGEVRAGRVDDRLAGLIDVTPTAMDAASRRPPSGMDGRSLLKPWQRENILLEYERTGPIPTWASLYSPGRMQYSEYYQPQGGVLFREYYDLAADPWQLSNMLSPPLPGAPAIGPLTAELAAARACAGPSCP